MSIASAETAIETRSIASIAPLVDLYDGFIVDGFGTLHHGAGAAPGAARALNKLVDLGKKVVIVVNSSLDHEAETNELGRHGVVLPAGSTMISSTGLANELLADREPQSAMDLGHACLALGWSIDGAIASKMPFRVVDDPLQADFILLAGVDRGNAGIERCRSVLTLARLRNLPLVCSNPDSYVLDAAWLDRGPGNLANDYERAGGRVHWIGKPHPAIYRQALQRLDLPPDRVVAIGDDVDIDIRGAIEAGIDTALLTSGAHHDHFCDAAGPASLLEKLTHLLENGSMRHAPQWLLRAFEIERLS